jgi:hypothetical protein
MSAKAIAVVLALTAMATLPFHCLAARPAAASPPDAPVQEMLELPVRVVDPDGKPVADAVVIPWALRSSQGHGLWQPERLGGFDLPRVTTDADGRATVPFPKYTILKELVLTLQVTLSIDHPDFAYVAYEDVNIPRKETGDHVATLQRGAQVEILPTQDGKPAALDGLYVMWSDNRSWDPEARPTPTADSGLQVPTMAAGRGQVLVVRLEGERATHFSPMIDLDLVAGEAARPIVALSPGTRLVGRLSSNVPRPIKNGRIKAETLPRDAQQPYVEWFTWAPVAEDGSFVIDSWPASEPIQLIGMCDGFVARSGTAPPEFKRPRLAELGFHDAFLALRAKANQLAKTAEASPENTSLSLASLAAKAATERVRPSFFQRPQVFRPEVFDQPLVLDMDAAERCDVLTVDEHGRPIADVKIYAGKNVGWWNIGSNIYGRPLFRSERILLTRDFTQCDETDACPKSLYAVTDKDGHASLDLVLGPDSLGTDRDDYELPIDQGRRDERVMVLAGETTHVALIMQPKGTEHLGGWDKLAGVLFGCTGEQCRRLLEDQGFRKSMEAVRAEFDAAKNPRDPKMLMKAYAKMAEAFKEVDDEEEVARWKQKAAEQAEKAGAEAPAEPSRN